MMAPTPEGLFDDPAARERMTLILAGALAMGYAIAAVFFLRFWKQVRDRLFLFFAIAFALLAVQRVALSLATSSDVETLQFYVLRLVAYAIILAAIVDKNRQARTHA
jgi:hypothetical protein